MSDEVSQQWEYCVLRLLAAQVQDFNPDGSEQVSYECNVQFVAPDGQVSILELAHINQRLPFNPFLKAMGLLGNAGWELIGIQHGLVPVQVGVTKPAPLGGTVRGADNGIAYFKRPVHIGRATNEPKFDW